MGFTAIWISPVPLPPNRVNLIEIVKNVSPEETRFSEGYHGYWAQDLYSLNPHFGDAATLQRLASELHARKMLLMVDVAPNHMASGPLSQIRYETFVPWNESRFFHPAKFNPDPQNQTQLEQYWLGDPLWTPLPDVNTELPEVEWELGRWIGELVSNYSIDGLRLDTVKHVRKSFWPGFCKAAGVFSLGEVWDGDPAYTPLESGY
jgi:alpha-amylase